MFERSKSGQQNRSLFFDVDYVCYVEGGAEDGAEHAHDITFWTSVFRETMPNTKIKCIPRGGKPILEALARDVIEKDLSNTIVAMDADYDHATGETISDKRVIYTHGYSWENDIYTIENLKMTYIAMSHAASIAKNVSDYFNENIAILHSKLRWAVRADFLALTAGSSLLPRNSPGRVIKHETGTGAPIIDCQEIRKLLVELRSYPRPRSFKTGDVGDVAKCCVGHIYELLAIYLLKSALRKFCRSASVSTSHARDIALQTFGSLLRSKSSHYITKYYRSCCVRL
jgi:hypothetical protein